jgi:hypothetical protein
MPQVITGYGLAVPFYAGLARATLGDLDLAVDHLERANRKHRSMRASFMIVRTDVVLARVLVDRGTDADLERAHSLAVPALTLAQERGYGYVEADARLVLDRIG